MLMPMKSRVEACRAVTYFTAGLLDRAHAGTDPKQKKRDLFLAELLIPVVKGGGTEMAVGVTSLGIQVHGGMGFIEETGAAQHWRDSRITTTYEGTTGIQANDLIFRKLMRDQGATAKVVFSEVQGTVNALLASDRPELRAIGAQLLGAKQAWSDATEWCWARSGRTFQPCSPRPFLTSTLPSSSAAAGGWAGRPWLPPTTWTGKPATRVSIAARSTLPASTLTNCWRWHSIRASGASRTRCLCTSISLGFLPVSGLIETAKATLAFAANRARRIGRRRRRTASRSNS